MFEYQQVIPSKKTSVLISALVFFMVLTLSACSNKNLGLFFDIPPPKPESEMPEVQDKAERQASNSTNVWDSPNLVDSEQGRPPIESLSSWEEVLDTMPKDYKGGADWSAALEQGLIRPSTGADPKSQLASIFQYDFIIAAEKPKNEGYFPHSAHTQWLGCKNCHMTLFPYKRNPAKMKAMRKGESCGACHGNVAFSLKQCKRCHLNR